jgi:hypothetical protein
MGIPVDRPKARKIPSHEGFLQKIFISMITSIIVTLITSIVKKGPAVRELLRGPRAPPSVLTQ